MSQIKACITTQKLCLVEEVDSSADLLTGLPKESIIREFECSEEQYSAITDPENSWSYCNNIIYLNQEEFITLW